MDENTRRFITEHAGGDVRQLALQASRFPLVDMPYALQQIEGRQKARRKLPMLYANPETEYPAKLAMEQCSGEAAARYKSSLVSGTSLIDMTGGFGIDCLFMSERFSETLYIERNLELRNIAEHNFRLFGRQQIRCISADSIPTVNELSQPADWIYVDPARRSKSGKKTVLLSDCEPDMTQIIGMLQKKARHILIKLSPMLDINAALRQLPGTTGIHVVSADNECKEVLFIIAGTEQPTATEPGITAVRLTASDTQPFHFTQTEERQAEPTYTAAIRNFLYEPDSAILKAGAFKTTAVRYGLEKLHPNTHLYTSDTLHADFCGRIFQIESPFSWQKNDIKHLRNTVQRANIVVRNFPAGTDAVRKKLRIGDGGDIFLFATTLADNTHTLLKAQRVTR